MARLFDSFDLSYKHITYNYFGSSFHRFDDISFNQVEDFVSRFMPAYEAYVPALYGTGPERKDGVPVMMVTVDEERYPITSQLM